MAVIIGHLEQKGKKKKSNLQITHGTNQTFRTPFADRTFSYFQQKIDLMNTLISLEIFSFEVDFLSLPLLFLCFCFEI